jgi:hypothetical protein
MRIFKICTHPQILLGRSNQGEWGERDTWHAWERRGNCARFWWESPNEKDHSEDRGVEGGWNQNGPKEIGWGLWSGFSLRALVNTALNFCVLASRSCDGHICLSVLLFLCFKNTIFCQMIN